LSEGKKEKKSRGRKKREERERVREREREGLTNCWRDKSKFVAGSPGLTSFSFAQAILFKVRKVIARSGMAGRLAVVAAGRHDSSCNINGLLEMLVGNSSTFLI
jgi:hypothetical protein